MEPPDGVTSLTAYDARIASIELAVTTPLVRGDARVQTLLNCAERIYAYLIQDRLGTDV